MTGAPKLCTMQIIEEVEGSAHARAYAGAFGWVLADGRADLGVVIRSLMTSRRRPLPARDRRRDHRPLRRHRGVRRVPLEGGPVAAGLLRAPDWSASRVSVRFRGPSTPTRCVKGVGGAAWARAPTPAVRVVQQGDVGAGRADAEGVGLRPLSSVANGTVTVSTVGRGRPGPRARRGRRGGRRATRRSFLSTSGGRRGRPPERRRRSAAAAVVHTDATTGPPGRVTRTISRRPASGSLMKCTTSWAKPGRTRRRVRQLLGSRRAYVDAREPGGGGVDERRGRVDRGDLSAPGRSTSRAVSAPGPQPTSSTRSVARRPAIATS